MGVFFTSFTLIFMWVSSYLFSEVQLRIARVRTFKYVLCLSLMLKSLFSTSYICVKLLPPKDGNARILDEWDYKGKGTIEIQHWRQNSCVRIKRSYSDRTQPLSHLYKCQPTIPVTPEKSLFSRLRTVAFQLVTVCTSIINNLSD